MPLRLMREIDLRIDIFRSGAESAIRVTHLPTGLVETLLSSDFEHQTLGALKNIAINRLLWRTMNCGVE